MYHLFVFHRLKLNKKPQPHTLHLFTGLIADGNMQKLLFAKGISTYCDCSGFGWNVLTFFITGFVSKPVLITHQCFGYGWMMTSIDDKSFSHSTQPTPSAIRLHVGKFIQLTWTEQRQVPCCVMSCTITITIFQDSCSVWLGIGLPSEEVK